MPGCSIGVELLLGVPKSTGLMDLLSGHKGVQTGPWQAHEIPHRSAAKVPRMFPKKNGKPGKMGGNGGNRGVNEGKWGSMVGVNRLNVSAIDTFSH